MKGSVSRAGPVPASIGAVLLTFALQNFTTHNRDFMDGIEDAFPASNKEIKSLTAKIRQHDVIITKLVHQVNSLTPVRYHTSWIK